MRHQNSVFHTVLKHVPWHVFDRLVDAHGADARVRRLSTRDQFIALLSTAAIVSARQFEELRKELALRCRLLRIEPVIIGPFASPFDAPRGQAARG